MTGMQSHELSREFIRMNNKPRSMGTKNARVEIYLGNLREPVTELIATLKAKDMPSLSQQTRDFFRSLCRKHGIKT